ncbi:histidine kinase/DNA gyrase B/HSP90-like ATPase [Marinomonas rhizomae]|uniref:histidine kinase n=1 Tax=Marinomonas rhizomae TaxID=491948 RepID=A0A366JD62_9GAMM|nr:ATP-binding protein [Marinomonas rhizomae]RBP84225.1 histidine kinase/DNA gyrase B/HSP90-like ATPase [Marinomonas rhizomae]
MIFEANTQDVNVNSLFDNIFELLEVPEGVTITRDIRLEHFTAVWTPLETVMRNLISNAIKHHDQSTGSIVIGCAADNNFCHFTICDDGPGMMVQVFQ